MENSDDPDAITLPFLDRCSTDWSFQRHESLVIESLERDVRDAASVGQALLMRHEAYVADAEQERLQASSKITSLELKNTELQTENARIACENEALQQHVDGLNTTIADSDAQVKHLMATLQSTQQEVHRLNILASRAELLETQLMQLEVEQACLQNTLIRTAEEERMANQRWRESQRSLDQIQLQLEAIETEATAERQRHAEVVERMERRSVVEKELQASAARLKGQTGKAANDVVSSFVKEILQDNANLQLSMVELQELLSTSQDEMEMMREQLTEFHTSSALDMPRGRALEQELNAAAPDRKLSQELHVHHHYHAPSRPQPAPAPPRARMPTQTRPRRKRTSARHTPFGSISTLDSVSHSPSRKAHGYHSSKPSESSITSLQRFAPPKRWSSTSTHTNSSLAYSMCDSPTTGSYAPSTIFERAFPESPDYSRPTSPESCGEGPSSPIVRPKAGSRLSSTDEPWFSPGSLPARFSTLDTPLRLEEDCSATRKDDAPQSHVPSPQEAIEEAPTMPTLALEPDNAVETCPSSPSRDLAQCMTTPLPSPSRPHVSSSQSPTRPSTAKKTLRRTPSQSSLYSISGMDIHSTFPTSPERPSPTLSGSGSTSTYSRPAVLRSRPSTHFSSGPILTNATAQASRERANGFGLGSGRELLVSHLGTSSRSTSLSSSGPLSASASEQKDRYSPLTDTLGRKVGGWFAGRWSSGGVEKSKLESLAEEGGRRVEVEELDEDALRECLGEGGAGVES